jgi:hypothetical protein
MLSRVNGLRVRTAPWVVLLGTLAHGCAYVSSTMPLAPMMTPPPAPQFKPTVEQTVGDFAYTVGDRKMITSNVQGMQLNTDILGSWKQSGYIADERYVENGAFTRGADCDVTLNGSQYGESHIVMQVLSYLTLFLVPYSVTQNYDLQYAVQDGASWQLYRASVQTTETIYVELFLLFALPWSVRNHDANMALIGDYLYKQLRDQGAFQKPGENANHR